MFITGNDIQIEKSGCGCDSAESKTPLEKEVKLQRYALIVLALLILFKK